MFQHIAEPEQAIATPIPVTAEKESVINYAIDKLKENQDLEAAPTLEEALIRIRTQLFPMFNTGIRELSSLSGVGRHKLKNYLNVDTTGMTPNPEEWKKIMKAVTVVIERYHKARSAKLSKSQNTA
jgi:hypothetical protein